MVSPFEGGMGYLIILSTECREDVHISSEAAKGGGLAGGAARSIESTGGMIGA